MSTGLEIRSTCALLGRKKEKKPSPTFMVLLLCFFHPIWSLTADLTYDLKKKMTNLQKLVENREQRPRPSKEKCQHGFCSVHIKTALIFILHIKPDEYDEKTSISRLKKNYCKLYTDKKTSNLILKCLSYFKMEKISAFLSSSHPGEVEGVSVNVLEYNRVIQLRAHIIQFTL